MIYDFLFLIAGFVLLIQGAEFLLKGATSFAYKFGISKMVIGLTIIALGTSLPELVISIFSSVEGKSDLLFGNIIGSNIANILLILGISAVISPLVFKNKTVKKEIPVLIFTSALLIFLTTFFTDANILNAWKGGILLLVFAGFIIYITRINHLPIEEVEVFLDKMSKTKSLLYIFLGLFGLIAGAKLIVSGGTSLAIAYGVSEAVIGLVVVAIGTSLPELATSIAATRRHDYEIAIGNVVGSNIINILLILGISATINPILVPQNLLLDLYLYAVVTVILLILVIFNKYQLSKFWGATFLIVYIMYVVANITI